MPSAAYFSGMMSPLVSARVSSRSTATYLPLNGPVRSSYGCVRATCLLAAACAVVGAVVLAADRGHIASASFSRFSPRDVASEAEEDKSGAHMPFLRLSGTKHRGEAEEDKSSAHTPSLRLSGTKHRGEVEEDKSSAHTPSLRLSGTKHRGEVEEDKSSAHTPSLHLSGTKHHGEAEKAVVTTSVQPSSGGSPWGFAFAMGNAVTGFLETAALDLHLMTSTRTTTTVTSTTTTDTVTSTTLTKTGTTTTGSTTTATTSMTSTSTLTFTSTTATTTTTKLCTLFCWSVVRVEGYEPALVEKQYWNKASIFECDEYSLYSNGGVVQVGDFTTIEIPAHEVKLGDLSKAGTTTSSWLNTMIFMKAWDLVLQDGKWWAHEWTVKVDPDAVFFPHRLKVKLYNYYAAEEVNGPALFVANCDRSWNGQPYSLKLFGSLEVFTRNALGMYKAHGAECKEDLDWHGWGEDMYMQNCMQKMNVGVINGVSFLGDNRCYGAPCSDTTKVAFHDFKDIGGWLSCWGASKASENAFIMK